MTQPGRVWKVLDPEAEASKAGLYLEDIGYGHVAIGTFIRDPFGEADRSRLIVLTFNEWVEVAHAVLEIAIKRAEEEHDATD